MAGEVITIQAGHLANFTGSHFWNIQDELLGLAELPESAVLAKQTDYKVLFRERETSRGHPTCTPRLVLYDLSGSTGGASISGVTATGGSVPPVTTWGGPVAVHAAPRTQRSRFAEQLEQEPDQAPEPGSQAEAEAHAFQASMEQAARDLEDDGAVRSWTDFLKAQLDPACVRLLPGLWQGAADFDGFGTGAGILSRAEAREEALNALRRAAEECDRLQGLQAVVEDLAGWGHFSWELLQAARDDLGAAPVALWALRASQPEAATCEAAAAVRRRLSEVVSLARLSEVSSMYIPLQPPPHIPGVRWRPGSAFHEGALCAAVLDSATLPYRLARDPPPSPLGPPLGAADMHSLTQLLASGSNVNNLVGCFAALPCTNLPEAHAAAQASAADARVALREGNAAASAPFTSTVKSWTPGMPAGVEELQAESIVLRGPRRAIQPINSNEAMQLLDSALLLEGVRCVRHRCVVPQPLPIPLPFPRLFSAPQPRRQPPQIPNGLHPNGMHAPPRAGSDDMARVSVLTRLCASPVAGEVASASLHSFRGLVRSGQGRAILQGWGYTDDDVAEVEERLQAMAGAFDSDDDM